MKLKILLLVDLRDMRLKYMHEQMIKDPAVKLKLATIMQVLPTIGNFLMVKQNN